MDRREFLKLLGAVGLTVVGGRLLGAPQAESAPRPRAGRKWYVAPRGRPGSPATPQRPTSLFSALDRAGAGDTIILRGGSYAGPQLSKRMIFLQKEGLTLRAAEGERPVLSIPVRRGERVSSGSCVIWFYAPRCTVEGLEVIGGRSHCIKMEHPECVVRRCRLHGSGADAVKLVRGADDCLIEDCEIYDTGKLTSNAEGVDNVAADGVVVRRCHVHHIASNGIYMKGGARNCIIEANLVTDCEANGIMLGQSTGKKWMTSEYECRDSIARNNIIMRTKGSGFAFEAALNCRFFNNTLYDVAREVQGAVNVNANSHHTPSRKVAIANNVVVVPSGRPLVFVHALGVARMDDMFCDYNLYYQPRGRYRFWYEPEKKYWDFFRHWRAGTPFDRHSILADPKLDLARKLMPLPGSPVIDAGMPVGDAVPTDYLGTPRPQGRAFDLGAYERKV